jgi:hypothetical protein
MKADILNSITMNTVGLPPGNILLRIKKPRKPKGIIEKIKSWFGKKFMEEEIVQSYYRRKNTIFVKRYE